MRSQFEMEKRLEKQLISKENIESSKAALMKMLEVGSDRNEEWKPSGNE